MQGNNLFLNQNIFFDIWALIPVKFLVKIFMIYIPFKKIPPFPPLIINNFQNNANLCYYSG